MSTLQLTDLTMGVSHFKSGWFGLQSSGKTTTATLAAIGLHQHLKLKSPIWFYDSERGADFQRRLLQIARIKAQVVQSRSFKVLTQFISEAVANKVEIIIIDSITHPWQELLQAYTRGAGRKFIRIQDWGPIKEQWKDGYSLPFVNAPLHIFMCGRSANVFEDVAEEDSGKKGFKAVKVGTKMKTEAEMAYEPNFLVEMEKVFTGDGGGFVQRATVLKDRSFVLDGATTEFSMPRKKQDGVDIADLEKLLFENKPWEFIRPHIMELNLGGDGPGVDTSTSTEMFEDGSTARRKELQRRELRLEEAKELLAKYWPGRDTINLKAKNDIIEGVAWACGQRIRNWRYVEEKFSDEQTKSFFTALARITVAPIKAELDEALKLGMSGDGKKVIDADAAPKAVYEIVQKLWQGDYEEPDPEAEQDDLPF